MRPYAETMRELIAGVGRASASVRGLPLLQQRDEVQNVAHRPAHGRPRPRRAVQRADPAPRLRARAAAAAARARASASSPSARRAARPSPSAATTSAGEFTGFTDRPAYADAQAIAHRVAELFTEGEVDRVILALQRLRLPARAARDRAGRAPDLGRHPRDGRGGAPRRRAPRPLSSSSRAAEGRPEVFLLPSTSDADRTAAPLSRWLGAGF